MGRIVVAEVVRSGKNLDIFNNEAKIADDYEIWEKEKCQDDSMWPLTKKTSSGDKISETVKCFITPNVILA